MEYNLQILANWLNTLDTYYEYSHNEIRFHNGLKMEESIAHWLHGLGEQETKETIALLDKAGMFNYERYFKNK